MDPRAMAELFPDWKEKGAPLNVPVSEDRFLFLTDKKSFKTPNFLLPGCFQNHGNYVISLGSVARWLGQQAEGLGVEIFPGFAAAEVLYDEKGAVRGVATGDMGVNRKGEHTDAFQPGIELHAKYTFFAEGCRGNLGKLLEAKFGLRKGSDPQVYGIGLKELWISSRKSTGQVWWCTPRGGRWTATPMAAPSCITPKTTRWPSVSWLAWATAIPT
jgi:electron-transferring-flavoprotein dehydrogenase